jgi:hypothetical protein
VICANVANVYSSSVGWEVLAPASLVGRKEYLILGLVLTMIFILISGLFSIRIFLDTSDSSLVNLCLVLLIGFIIRRSMNKLPGMFEQMTYLVAWGLATVFNILQYSEVISVNYSPLLIGFGAIIGVIMIAFGFRRIKGVIF